MDLTRKSFVLSQECRKEPRCTEFVFSKVNWANCVLKNHCYWNQKPHFPYGSTAFSYRKMEASETTVTPQNDKTSANELVHGNIKKLITERTKPATVDPDQNNQSTKDAATYSASPVASVGCGLALKSTHLCLRCSVALLMVIRVYKLWPSRRTCCLLL